VVVPCRTVGSAQQAQAEQHGTREGPHVQIQDRHGRRDGVLLQKGGKIEMPHAAANTIPSRESPAAVGEAVRE